MLEEDVEAVKDKVDDPMMCEKVRLFIYAPPEIQLFYKEQSCEFVCLADRLILTRGFQWRRKCILSRLY